MCVVCCVWVNEPLSLPPLPSPPLLSPPLSSLPSPPLPSSPLPSPPLPPLPTSPLPPSLSRCLQWYHDQWPLPALRLVPSGRSQTVRPGSTEWVTISQLMPLVNYSWSGGCGLIPSSWCGDTGQQYIHHSGQRQGQGSPDALNILVIDAVFMYYTNHAQ